MTPEEFAGRLAAAPRELRATVGRETRRSAATIETEARLSVSGRVLRVRSGRLRASIVARVEQDADGLTLTARAGGRGPLGASVVYAAAHEYGARIRPVRARMLAIPLPAALTRAGVARYVSPLRQTAAGQLYLSRSASGALLLRSTGTGREPLFLLRYQVRIPARPYLGPAVEAERPRLVARLGDAVRVALLGGRGEGG